MNSIAVKISLILSVLALALAGYLFFSVRHSAERITALESVFTVSNFSLNSAVAQDGGGVILKDNAPSSITLVTSQQIGGMVDGIIGNRLTVSAEVPIAFDIHSPALPPMAKRNFLVDTSNATIFKIITISNPTKIINPSEAVPLSRGLSEIKIGDRLIITAITADGNFFNKSVFTAKEIILIRK